MKRSMLSLAIAVLAVGALATPVSAARPLYHAKEQPFTVTVNLPAGSLCDFAFRQTFTEQDTVTEFSDGRRMVHVKATDTNWNLDSGASLTESVSWGFVAYPDGHTKIFGLLWHLRDADGKMRVVRAGQIIYDADGDLTKFTPNSGPDTGVVLCPALGGNPA